MGTVATLSSTWIKRQTIIGSVMLAIGLWFFYDGAVTYPKSNERFHAYQKFVQEGREDAWPAYAQQRQWSEKPPEKEYRTTDQYVLGTAAVLGSLAAFGLLALSWRRRIVSDGVTITATNGKRVPISSMVSIDLRHWDRKGIAYALYRYEGQQGRIKIDDYKYMGAEIILREVEQHLVIDTPAAKAEENVDRTLQ